MKLIFKNITRIETNPNVINELIRKGWTEIIENINEPPEYDQLTERLQYNAADGTYEIVPLNQQEIKYNLFYKKIDEGFLVEPENFVLGLHDEDRSAFSQMMVLLREALEMGLISLTTPQIIKDKSGTFHTITTERFQQIIISYGFYYKTIWEQL